MVNPVASPAPDRLTTSCNAYLSCPPHEKVEGGIADNIATMKLGKKALNPFKPTGTEAKREGWEGKMTKMHASITSF